MIQEFESVVFEKDELEFRELSEQKALLPILVNQDSESHVEIIFKDIWKQTVHFRFKSIEIDTLMELKRYR